MPGCRRVGTSRGREGIFGPYEVLPGGGLVRPCVKPLHATGTRVAVVTPGARHAPRPGWSGKRPVGAPLCYTPAIMAFTIENLRDLLALLRQHPEWREAVRREVLTEELLDLPALVRRLSETVDRLAVGQERVTTDVERLTETVARLAGAQERLTSDVERLTADVRELARIVARLDGRVGNLEGWRYQARFNVRARATEIIRRPVEINLADLETALDARDRGVLTDDEWKQLLSLDFLLKGWAGPGRDAPERLVALEVSQVVDSRDVQRARDRAAILTRTGLVAIPAVGGRRLTRDAATLAEQLGVRTLIDMEDEE